MQSLELRDLVFEDKSEIAYENLTVKIILDYIS